MFCLCFKCFEFFSKKNKNCLDTLNIDTTHDKYITTTESHTLTADDFAARLAQANLASNGDIGNFVKKVRFWW